MTFNRTYFLPAVVLFLIEAAIAAYMDDAFVRPYFGDLLVVILIYCIIKTLVDSPPIKTAVAVFIFACFIEVSQYFHLVQLLGWGSSATAITVMGTFFSFVDIIMYALGALVVIGVETYLKNTNTTKTHGTSHK